MKNWTHPPGQPYMVEADPMSPESQTVGKCAELREGCRSAIFDHIDARHGAVLDKLTDLEKSLAYRDGRDTGNRPAVERRFPWREVGAAVAIVTGALAAGCLAVWKLIGAGS